MKSQMDSWKEGVTFMAQRLGDKITFSTFVGPMTLDWVRKFLYNTHLQYEFSVKTDPRRPAEWKIIIKLLHYIFVNGINFRVEFFCSTTVKHVAHKDFFNLENLDVG